MTAPPLTAWYDARHCTHAHCPNECEHPQPFLAGEELICAACWFERGEAMKMEPCGPEVCE